MFGSGNAEVKGAEVSDAEASDVEATVDAGFWGSW